jgi:hypothetical protein
MRNHNIVVNIDTKVLGPGLGKNLMRPLGPDDGLKGFEQVKNGLPGASPLKGKPRDYKSFPGVGHSSPNGYADIIHRTNYKYRDKSPLA